MKRSLFAALAAFAVIIPGVMPATAAPNSPEIVVDVGTGQVLYADEATRPWYPASTTKMMTAYVALRAVKAGLIKLDTPLVASARAAGQRPSKIGIRPGQEITLDNALKILMVKSANDLAVVIAEGIAGSLPGFSAMMNNEARRIGMRESNFVNPHGFHDPAHYSSARDLALLARTMLFEFPEYRGYWSIGAVRLGNKVMKNTNGLIGRYPGAEGFKTGFVCASGFNLVGLANQGGRQVLAVVLGASSGAERTIRAAGLLDKGASGWGGGYGSLTGLASVGGTPPNMRGAICTGRRLSLLTEEDTGAALIGAGGPTGDSSSVYAVGAVASSGRSQVGGRTLGPRAELAAIQVYLGRTPGSTEVARGPGNGAINGVRNTATAFAPTPSAAIAAPVTARAAKPAPVDDADDEAPAQASAPTKLLPAAITGGGPGAIGLRRAATAESAPKPGAIAARSPAGGMEAARAAARAGAISPKADDAATKGKADKGASDKARKVATKADPKAKAKSDAKAKPDTKSKTAAKAEPKVKTGTKTAAKAEPKAKADAKSAKAAPKAVAAAAKARKKAD